MFSPQSDDTALVTGGAGFLGSALVRRLLALGWRKVYVLDDFSTGSEKNLASLSGPIEVCQHDLAKLDDDKLRSILPDVQMVFHLAAVKNRAGQLSPERLWQTNVDGTFRLLDQCARAGIARVVFTSSLFAYGRVKGDNLVETEPSDPMTLYGLSKLTGENLLKYYARTSGMSTLSLRVFFAYGSRQSQHSGYKTLINRTIERISKNLAPQIYGDGQQQLDYIYYEDVIDALIQSTEKTFQGDVLNVSTGSGSSVHDVVHAIRDMMDHTGEIEYGEPDETAGTRRVGDHGLAARRLNWTAATPLTEGLSHTCRELMAK